MVNWHTVFKDVVRVHEDSLTDLERQLDIGYPMMISIMNPHNGLPYKMYLYKTYFSEDIRPHHKIFYDESCPWDAFVISSIRGSIIFL